MKKHKSYNDILHLYFENDDHIWQFLKYLNYIDKKLQAEKPIPPRALKKFIAMINHAMNIDLRTKSDFVEQAKEKALSTIDNYKQNFLFEVQSISLIPEENSEVKRYKTKNLPVTERDLLTHIYRHFHALESFEELEAMLSDEKLLITNIAKWSRDFLRVIQTVNPSDFPKHNKLHIICGCILNSFGLIVDEEAFSRSNSKNLYYTEFLAAQCRHLFNKTWNAATKKR